MNETDSFDDMYRADNNRRPPPGGGLDVFGGGNGAAFKGGDR